MEKRKSISHRQTKRETKKGNRKRIPSTPVKRTSVHPLTFYTAPFLVPRRLPSVPPLHKALSVLFFLDDHLCDTSSTQCLASHKFLSLNTSQTIEATSKSQDHRCSNQTGRIDNDADPLDSSHSQVDTSTSIV